MILVPQPGIKLIPSAVIEQSPHHWTTREVHLVLLRTPSYKAYYFPSNDKTVEAQREEETGWGHQLAQR